MNGIKAVRIELLAARVVCRVYYRVFEYWIGKAYRKYKDIHVHVWWYKTNGHMVLYSNS